MLFRLFAPLGFLLALTGAALASDGVDHYSVGDLDVMVIRDADVSMGKQLLPELEEKAPEFLGAFAHGPVPAVDQTFFFRKGERNVLVDAGWGKEHKVEGHTADLLHENGIAESDITDILLTHMDTDHIGGLLNNGQPVYPNATLWIAKPEYAAWVGGGGVNRSQGAVDLAKKVAAAYKVRQFDFGDEILPGVKSVDAAGHTPGHTAYDIISGNDRMTIAGDLLHIAPVQLARPDLSTIYDMDGAKAAATRERLLNRAAEERALLAGMHFPMVSDVRKIPGNGYVMKQPR